MFRTRDFVLLFTIIVFLVAAIGATVVDQWFDNHSGVSTEQWPTKLTASTSPTVFSANTIIDQEADRVRRLNEMRNRVAEITLTQTTDTDDPSVQEDAAEVEELADNDEDIIAEDFVCADYTVYSGFWDSRGVIVSEAEGAILIERAQGTTTTLVAQLPVQTLPVRLPTCVSTDVVGFANDGSLIRNDEVSLYGIFGSDTQIGYALDGFPIYGTNPERGDVCGGLVVDGTYRYYLNPDRDQVVHCFAAAPVKVF